MLCVADLISVLQHYPHVDSEGLGFEKVNQNTQVVSYGFESKSKSPDQEKADQCSSWQSKSLFHPTLRALLLTAPITQLLCHQSWKKVQDVTLLLYQVLGGHSPKVGSSGKRAGSVVVEYRSDPVVQMAPTQEMAEDFK